MSGQGSGNIGAASSRVGEKLYTQQGWVEVMARIYIAATKPERKHVLDREAKENLKLL